MKFIIVLFFCCALGTNTLAQVPRLGIQNNDNNIELTHINYNEIDEYARNTPEFRNQSALVEYLIKPYKKDALAKTRVIFAWIAFHVQYDFFKYNTKTKLSQTGNTYQTRLGVCSDFAKLFVEMAQKANLKAEYISGYAGYDLIPEEIDDARHAWNAVKINNKWHLLDITWALGGDYGAYEDITRVKNYKRLVKQRKKNPKNIDLGEQRFIINKWFLTPPEEMIKTHFPTDIKWQLLKKSVTPKKIWKQNKINRTKK